MSTFGVLPSRGDIYTTPVYTPTFTGIAAKANVQLWLIVAAGVLTVLYFQTRKRR